MYKPYIKPVSTASPDIQVPEPHISRIVFIAVRFLARIYLYIVLGITKVVLRNGHPLFEAFQRALAGKSRCILAFRHPNGGEGQLLTWFILFKLRFLARKAGVKFCRRPFLSFVYGYEVARWGGGVARWVMPGLGGMPIHHAKVDSAGMKRINNALAEGPYPLAIAPEGQVSYTTESIPRLEQGVVRIGFQAVERFEKSGRDIPVEILPVSIHFRYGNMGRWSLKKLIRKIEKYTGLKQKKAAGFTERLTQARELILELNEKRYGLEPDASADFSERVDAVMEAALDKAEKILNIRPKVNETVDRMYHIRQICWDRMAVPGITSLNNHTLLERAVFDLSAGEAWYASRHMELVDFVWYFRVPVPKETDPLYVRLEYAQNLWDFASRTMGGTFSNRVLNVHPKRVLFQIGAPINLTERFENYKKDKRAAIAAAMNDMKAAFEECITRASEYQI